MKKKLIDIAVFAVGLALILLLKHKNITDDPDAVFLVFGAGLFLAYLLGKIFGELGLPNITSYLLMGVLLGPYIMNVFTKDIIASISFIDHVALSLIGMVAGGEIHLRNSRVSLVKVLIFVVVQIIIIFAIVFGVLKFFGAGLAGGIFASTTAVIFMAVIANAKSPSTTVAVIIETESKGKFTDYILTSAIFKDFIVIILFTFVLSLYSASGDVSVGAVIFEEVVSSLLGIALAFVIILYIKYVKQNEGIFVLLFTVIFTWIAKSVHLNPLLMFLFMGIAVNNLSRYGKSLVEIIEDNSGIVYLVFFFMAGTIIDIPALKYMWVAAVLIVVLRTASMFVGCYIAGALVKESKEIKQLSFLGFIGQAGVSIGFANIIGNSFPDWGQSFRTLILAVVAINQIIGPLGFKYALRVAGEDVYSRTANALKANIKSREGKDDNKSS